MLYFAALFNVIIIDIVLNIWQLILYHIVVFGLSVTNINVSSLLCNPKLYIFFKKNI